MKEMTSKFNKHRSALSTGEQEWMNKMRTSAEAETMTVLFAKSIAEVPKKQHALTAVRAPSYKKAQSKSNSRSISPRKCASRLKNSLSEAVPLKQNPSFGRSDKNQYKSSIRIPSTSCESLAKPTANYQYRRCPSPNSSLPMSSSSSCESLDDKRKCRGRNFARSMPSVASLSVSLKKSECSEPKVRMRHNRAANTNNLAYRHTIRIGDEKADEIFNNNCAADTLLTKCSNISNANLATVSTRSPNLSDDSGQFSGRHSYLKSTQIMSDSAGSSDFSNHLKTSLPSYARMASTMDHILRTANTIYSLLDSNLDDPKVTRELIQKVQIYIQILQQSPCQPFLVEEDFTLVTNTLHQISSFSSERSQAYLKALDYSNVAVRRMLEQSLIVLLRITTNYLNECTNRDRLLIIALEHLVHLLLFGDELCLEAIRCKTVDNIVGFCRLQTTSNDTLRLLLRVLAVLCGVGRGCVQLISIGGLDLIIQLFNSRPSSCATEAAGILTQLTSNPNQPFIRLACTQLDKIVDRLLELIDDCRNAESLLLCSAALANFSMLNTVVIKMLYERNAIQRLVNALKGPNNCTIFIQEQVVIIFSQLAAYSYEQALVAQGAIPVLLKMLRAGESMPQRFDYSRRIRYKAAVCLATIASSSLGLKSIHENYGCEALEMVLQRENFNENSPGNSPFLLVCANIRNQLQAIYNKPRESAV